MSEDSVQASEIQGFPVLAVSGYLNGELAGDLQGKAAALLREKKVNIIIDLSACKVINSPGVSTLLDLVLNVQEDMQGMVVFCGLDPLKQKVFKMAGILPRAKVAPALADAPGLFS